MKRKLIPILAALLVLMAAPVFADFELGVSGTPYPDGSGAMTFLTGYHLGFTASIFCVSWDAIAVPNVMIQNWTGSYDVPGFLNLYDAGIKLYLRPLIAYAEVGLNNLYVYQVGILDTGFGANLRVGVGLRFGWWGLDLTGTTAYSSWASLQYAIGGLFSDATRQSSFNAIAGSLVPSIQFNWYF